MTVQDLTFDCPQGAYLIFAVFMLALLFWRLFQYRMNRLSIFSSQIISQLFVFRPNSNYFAKVTVLCFVWIFASFALMQPKGDGRYPTNQALNKPHEKQGTYIRQRKAHEFIFLMDASASMTVRDSRSGLSRIEYAKEVADQIVSRLNGENGSLYAYTTRVTQLSPPTMDYLFIRLMIRGIQINEGGFAGTDITEALKTIQNDYLLHPLRMTKTLVIFTDGGDNRLEDLKGQGKQQAIDSILSLIGDPKSLQLRVFTIGFGTKAGGIIPGITYEGKPVRSSLDDDLLIQLSQKGRGAYFEANQSSATDIAESIFKILAVDSSEIEDEIVQKKAEVNDEQSLIFDLYYQIPLGIAILLLGLVICLPDTFRKKVFIFFISVLCVRESAWASSEDQSLMDQAGVYFDARNYQKSIDIYRALMHKEELDLWQQAVVRYNLGSAYIENKQWKEGIDTLNHINRINIPNSPLLNRRIATNLAIANYRQAVDLSEALTLPDANPTDESYHQIVSLLHQALKEEAIALKAECQLREIEGLQACKIPQDLEEIRSFSKQKLAITFQLWRQFQEMHTSLQNGLILLLASLHDTSASIDFLEDHNKSSLFKKYLDAFILDVETWLPLWNSIKSQMESELKDGENEKKKIDLLVAGQKEIEYTIAMLKEENLAESKTSLIKGLADLDQLIQLMWGEGPLLEFLQRLIMSFQRALAQEPLQEGMFLGLQNQLNQANTKISSMLSKNAEIKTAQEVFLGVIKNQSQGLSALKEGKEDEAQMFFEVDMQSLKRLSYRLNKVKENMVETLLKNSVEEQKHGLLLSRLNHDMIENGKTFPQAYAFILDSQKRTLEDISPFFKIALQEQKRRFKEDAECQYQPWSEVIPLFEKGMNEALQIESLLSGSSSQVSVILEKQEDTLSYWEEALDKLKNIKTNPTCQKKAPQAQQQKSANDSTMQLESSVENVLRLLQQMDSEDRIPPRVGEPLLKKGEKPW